MHALLNLPYFQRTLPGVTSCPLWASYLHLDCCCWYSNVPSWSGLLCSSSISQNQRSVLFLLPWCVSVVIHTYCPPFLIFRTVLLLVSLGWEVPLLKTMCIYHQGIDTTLQKNEHSLLKSYSTQCHVIVNTPIVYTSPFRLTNNAVSPCSVVLGRT